MSITPEQIIAARALLRLGQSDLAVRSQQSIITIRRVESPNRIGQVTAETLADIRRTLEHAGAEFIEDGVRRRHAPDHAALLKRLQTISRRSAKRQRGRETMNETDLYDSTPTDTAGKSA